MKHTYIVSTGVKMQSNIRFKNVEKKIKANHANLARLAYVFMSSFSSSDNLYLQ